MKLIIDTYSCVFKKFNLADQNCLKNNNKICFVTDKKITKNKVFQIFKELFAIKLTKINTQRNGMKSFEKKVTITFKNPKEYINFVGLLKKQVSL